QLVRENAELKRRLDMNARKLEDFEKDQDSLAQALLSAQRLADTTVRDAQTKAEITIHDAEIKAEKIKEKVKAAILAEQQDFLQMKQGIVDFRTKILDLYKEQIEVILKTPDETALGIDKKEPEAAPPAAPVAAQEEPVAPEPHEAAAEIAAPQPFEATDTTAPQPAGGDMPAAGAKAEPQATAGCFKLNLKFYEETGEYLPLDRRKGERFKDLKFGPGYDIALDDEKGDSVTSLFRKKK
ncbi:MAG: DivIVA domain-containing protein, partial [Clostridia bacterium]|nr:DivIVA domain-containing protein [Clostridia bacterium]